MHHNHSRETETGTVGWERKEEGSVRSAPAVRASDAVEARASGAAGTVNADADAAKARTRTNSFMPQ